MKKIFLSSYLFLVYCLLGILAWGNHDWLLFSMLVSTFIISFIVYKNNKTGNYLKISLLLGIPLIIILLVKSLLTIDFSRSLPYIIFIPISIYLSFLYFKKKHLYIPLLSSLLFSLVSFVLFPTYFIYYHNRTAEKNIIFKNVDLINASGKPIELDENKIIVLDFWSTDCSICYKKFPGLQATFDKYKNNKNVEIYSVNVPLKRDSFSKTIKILDSIGYTFPKLYAVSNEQIANVLHINAFPHLIIVKNKKIRYDGMLVTEKTTLLYNIESEIEKLISE